MALLSTDGDAIADILAVGSRRTPDLVQATKII